MNLRLVQKLAVWTTCLLVASGPLYASTTYQYTGNAFDSIVVATPPSSNYTTLMSVTGSITTISPLQMMSLGDISGVISSYSLNDGRRTLTESNSFFLSASVEVDSAGEIVKWDFLVFDEFNLTGGSEGDQAGFIRTTNDLSQVLDIGTLEECTVDASGSLVHCPVAVDQGSVANNPGAWATAPVPVPAAAWLFGSALGLLGWMRQSHA